MAKETVSKKYGSGEAYRNDKGDIILNEIKKEEVIPYNLSQIIDDLDGAENISISISFTKDIESNVEQ